MRVIEFHKAMRRGLARLSIASPLHKEQSQASGHTRYTTDFYRL